MTTTIVSPTESQKILDYSLDIICTVDGNGVVVNINQAFTAILGYPLDAILGNRFTSFIHPDDLEATKEMGRANKQGQPVKSFVNRYRHENGSYVYLSWCSLWSEESGLFFAIARDITEIQLQKQKSLEKQNALHSTVELLTRQNQQLKSFQHMLTHNLRNHAGNISMLLGFLERDKVHENNKEVIFQLEKASGHLLQTIEELSEAIQFREQVMTPDRINLKEATVNLLKLFSADLEVHQAWVTFDYEQPEIQYPKVYFDSLLSNLISNSLKYKKPDEQLLITLSSYLNEQQNVHVLKYQDNGIGIDMDRHGNELFGLYKTFVNHPDAHGVGLFLIKTQLESQKASISVDSAPGTGATFTIAFPA